MSEAYLFKVFYKRGILSFAKKIVTKNKSYEEAERIFFINQPEDERINSIFYEGKVVVSGELLGREHQ